MKSLLILFLTTPLILFANEDLYIKLAQKIRSEHIKEMKLQGFQLVLFGGGMFNDVEEISVWFSLNATPTLEEARKIYVLKTQQLLGRVNQDKAVRPYLHDYPFTIRNLDYCLMFKKIPPCGSLGCESVYSMSSKNGKIYYTAYDPAYQSYDNVKTFHTETYEEAQRLVEAANALSKSST